MQLVQLTVTATDADVDNDANAADLVAEAGRTDTETLRREQQQDPSLRNWLKLAAEKKGNFFIRNGLYFSIVNVCLVTALNN